MTVSDPTREEVVAWLRANRNSYTRAAKHFGLSKAEVKAIWADHKGDPSRDAHVTPAPAREAGPKPDPKPDVDVNAEPVHMPKVERLEWQLAKALKKLEEVEGQEKATTLIGNLHRTIRDLGRDLDEERERLRLAGHRNDDEDDPEALIAELVQLVAAAPDQVIEALIEAIELRRNPPDKLE